MSFSVTDDTLDKYFGFLKNLDMASKKKLIDKLENSTESHSNDFDLTDLYGAWDDDRDSDVIIEEIKKARVPKEQIVKF